METLLIADDHHDSRTVLKILLEHTGYRVVEAVDGAEAVQAARRERPDLILMDLHMPVVNGWAATQALKVHPATLHIPVLAISTDEFPRWRLLEAGFCGYLRKPVPPAALVRAVADCLRARSDGRRWVELARLEPPPLA